MNEIPGPDEVFVISEGCTTRFPDLDLTLPAGELVCIPKSMLERVLTQPAVSQAFLHEAK